MAQGGVRFPDERRMSEPGASRTESGPSSSRDRMVRLAILLAAFVFVILYVFVL
jgi:hypothetical protein